MLKEIKTYKFIFEADALIIDSLSILNQEMSRTVLWSGDEISFERSEA